MPGWDRSRLPRRGAALRRQNRCEAASCGTNRGVDLGTKTVAVRAEVDVPMLARPRCPVAAQAIARR